LSDDRLKIAVFIDFDNIEIGVKSTLGAYFDIGSVLEALKVRKFSALTPQEVADAVVYAARAEPNCCPDLVELRPLGSA
jgi:hypothetical protein